MVEPAEGATPSSEAVANEARAKAEGKFAAELEAEKQKFNKLQADKDRQAEEARQEREKQRADHDAALAKQREENAGLKAAAETRTAEDKAELEQILSEMEEGHKAAINALPGSPSAREKLTYIKGNKALFTKPAPLPPVPAFGQPSGGAPPEARGDYKAPTIADLQRGGAKAVRAERDQLKKSFGG